MEPVPPAAEIQPPPRPRRERLWPSLLIALLLVVLDGWYFMPGPGAFVCLVLAIAGLIIAVSRAVLSNRPARPALLKFIIYGVALILIANLLSWQEEQARESAADVIVAVNAYHADRGLWPRTLPELVPSYLPEIPAVNMRHQNHFRYETDGTDAALAWYVALPTNYWQHDFVSGETVVHD